MPKAWDHLEGDVWRETGDWWLSPFFLFWLLLSLQMPTPHSLIPLHLSISLTARMVSFACGNLGLIHLERPTTMGVRMWEFLLTGRNTSYFALMIDRVPVIIVTQAGILCAALSYPQLGYILCVCICSFSSSLEQRRELLKTCFDSLFFLCKPLSSPLCYLVTEDLLKPKGRCVF